MSASMQFMITNAMKKTLVEELEYKPEEVEVSDERIRDVPNARVLRYYQSNGLIGRPLRYDGRRARYGFGHLVQAVAVKVLQREGLSLAQVQEALAGRSADEIAVLIEYASGGGGRGGDIAGEARPAASATEPDSSAPAAPGMPAPAPTSAPARLRSVWQVELARGVTVVIDPQQTDPEKLVGELDRLMDVVSVSPLDPVGGLSRQYALLGVYAEATQRPFVRQLAEVAGAKVVRESTEEMALEATGCQDTIDALVHNLRTVGRVRMNCTCPVALDGFETAHRVTAQGKGLPGSA